MSVLTAKSSIGTWLDDPSGGPLMRGFLTQMGQDEESLRPVRTFALQRLVELSQGKLPQSAVDALVLAANGGVMPEDDGTPELGWKESIVPDRFAGQTVIVTGAGSGIGRAVASRVAREGGKVIAVDISTERLGEFAGAHGDYSVVTVAGDITNKDDIAGIIAAADGRIDALANVAGIMDDMTPLHEVSDEVWERVFAVNVDGMFRLTRAVLPFMIAAGQGSIVNVASEAALRGSSAGFAYTASKHAVVGMTRSASFMYAPSGIRVNAVAPGPVATNIQARFNSELGKERIQGAMAILPPVAEAIQLAASITFLLSADGTNINGVILPSDGGQSAI
ncbi:NAD(P)-dependent dehydrogenase (short-subunit alcohol dehydrogenase family) [Glaciihabitans tibetensis]|uniref:NAD(P)-dependent dehydrogenase (Short-subunit alcohol dehydrogenase family) n=1 Tax=Glaciihabitans tibetensis TaxID=1266600 RepID=A0A2T0V5I7_9MICO|nr:NAD(P)-dependent dehydrogenase (short-subunit alcohol dehydrogenase family) [Glaciihabitans tibetensis]